MNYFKEILKGVLMGVANIIPGVSGGTMALAMGIYEKIIHAVNNIRKEFKQSIKTLLPYIIGIAIGIVALSFVIEFCLARFELPTMMAFVGLILGGLPPIIKRVENEKFKPTHLLSFLLFAAIIIAPTLITNIAGASKEVTMSFGTMILMFILGGIASASMVVPGVSGSMILMMLGYYDTVLSNITTFIKSLLAFEMGSVLTSAAVLIPFGIGVLVGIVITAKIIEKLLIRYPNATMWGIIALVVTSPFAILWGVNLNISVWMLLASVITFAIGFWISKTLSKEPSTVNENEKKSENVKKGE